MHQPTPLPTCSIFCPALVPQDTRRSARVQARTKERGVHFKDQTRGTQLDKEVTRGPKTDLQRNYSTGQTSQGTRNLNSGRAWTRATNQPPLLPTPSKATNTTPVISGYKPKAAKPPLVGGEMHFDEELDFVPRSFPAKEMGPPTPGSTNLNEQPEGSISMPPSPATFAWQRTPMMNTPFVATVASDTAVPVSQPGPVPLGGHGVMPPISTLIRVNDLCDQMQRV